VTGAPQPAWVARYPMSWKVLPMVTCCRGLSKRYQQVRMNLRLGDEDGGAHQVPGRAGACRNSTWKPWY
jgi:hypothetical protein